MRWPVWLLALVLCGPARGQAAPTELTDEEAFYDEYLIALQENHRAQRETVERLDAISGIRKYLKRQLRGSDLPDEMRAGMEEELETFEEISDELEKFLRASRPWLREMEAWIQTCTEAYPDIKKMERVRKASLWRRGNPIAYIILIPEPPVPAGQHILCKLVGLPRSRKFSWETTLGSMDPVPGRPDLAVWRAGSSTLIPTLAIHLELPGAPYAVHISRRVDLLKRVNLPSPEMRQAYEDALCALVNQEAGLEQDLAAPRTDDDAAEQERKDRIRLRRAYIEYYDEYLLPRLAETRGRVCARWERQRRQLRTRSGKFPMRIEPGGKDSQDRWHFVLSGAPEDTEVTWSVRDDEPGARETEVMAYPMALEVYLSATRERPQVLIARPDFRFFDLPVRLEWWLPTGDEESPPE